MKSINKVTATNDAEALLKAPYGLQGMDFITNDSDHIGHWYCIMAIEDNTTIDSSSMGVNWNENGGTLTTDFDLITGVHYYGDFRTISLVDGKIVAYRQ